MSNAPTMNGEILTMRVCGCVTWGNFLMLVILMCRQTLGGILQEGVVRMAYYSAFFAVELKM